MSEEAGEDQAGGEREDGEEPKVSWDLGQLAVQTLGKGAWLGAVPTGILGSGKRGIWRVRSR